MATETITSKANRAELASVIRRLPGVLSGRASDVRGIGAGFRARVTFVLLGLIQTRFEALGRGEADENGERWPDLSQSYLAYQKPKTGRGRPLGGGMAGGSGLDGLLTKEQDAAWWRHYRRNLTWLASRHPIGKAKSIAAAQAWNAVKAAGGRTKWDDPGFGKRQIGDYQILVNAGTLRVSLQAGDFTEGTGPAASYRPPAEQIAEATPGTLIVGTRVPCANAHHEGKGNLPARRLWPRSIPQSWWRQIMEQAIAGLSQIGSLLKQGDIR